MTDLPNALAHLLDEAAIDRTIARFAYAATRTDHDSFTPDPGRKAALSTASKADVR